MLLMKALCLDLQLEDRLSILLMGLNQRLKYADVPNELALLLDARYAASSTHGLLQNGQ